MANEQHVVVPPASEGKRADVFLAKVLPEVTRSHIKTLSEAGMLTISGKPIRASYRLRRDDVIVVNFPPVVSGSVVPTAIPLTIVFEDEELVVINKPAGLVTHPAFGHYDDTLVNAVLYHCPTLAGVGGEQRHGVVHRLDKDTSGLIIFAKTDRAHLALSAQFKNREVEKRYLALVMGNPRSDEGDISLPIGRHPRERQKMSASGRDAKEAQTHWRVCERMPFCALLEVSIKTGRTHQIRVHLSTNCYPVVGDRLYGKPNLSAISNTVIRSRLKSFARQALHSHLLAFVHPVRRERMEFTAPLPEDIASLCSFLRGEGK